MAGRIGVMICTAFAPAFILGPVRVAHAQSDAALADPTRPPVTVSEPVSTGDASVVAPGGLQTIIVGRGRKPMAVINGIMVGLGDKVGEATLVKLSESEAVLQGPAGREVLHLLPGITKTMDRSRLKKDEGMNHDK